MRWEEGGRRKEKTVEDDRKTGDLSINYNATATRDSQSNRLQQRSHSDMRGCRVEQTPREKSKGYGDLHNDRFEQKEIGQRNLHIKRPTMKRESGNDGGE